MDGRRYKSTLGAVFAAALLLLTGCQAMHADPSVHPTAAGLSTRDVLGLPRSLATTRLPSDAPSDADDGAAPAATPLPWFAYRNDVRPYVTAGVVYPTFETNVTRTYDRQVIYGDTVRDYYYQSTRRVRGTRLVR